MAEHDWFIEFFESIPEDKWSADKFNDPDGKHCALGHLLARDDNREKYNTFIRLIYKHAQEVHFVTVNAVKTEKFPQETPKQRVVAAVKYIKGLESAHTS